MGISEKQRAIMEKGASNLSRWIGSTTSVTLHTFFFLVSFLMPVLGVVSFDRMLLVLTTVVSLEAIYLSIFIQMSINMHNQKIDIIQEDIEELGEDLEEIGEDIEELGEDIEEIGEDIEEIQKDVDEIQENVDEIQENVDEIQENVDEIQGEANGELRGEKNESELLLSIQATLLHLQNEIEILRASR